jgi:hypothetical protein
VPTRIEVTWLCPSCEVAGQDPHAEPTCWNCDGPVVVTARPTVPTQPPPYSGDRPPPSPRARHAAGAVNSSRHTVPGQPVPDLPLTA